MKSFVGTRAARLIWKIPGSRRFYGSLIAGLKPESVVIDGHTIHLDENDSLLLSVNGEYEAAESKIFRGCIDEAATVIDVGGHIGYYTLQAARAVGPAGRVIAFEPAPDNFALLERNVADNGYVNVTLVRSAVADQTGRRTLTISADNTGDNRLANDAATGQTVSVETISLDDYFGDQMPRVAVIKMDIQGSEPLALAGARRLVAANDDIVLFTELSNEHLSVDGLRDYLADLADAGFELFEIDERGGPPRPVQTDALLRRTSGAGAGTHTDLVCAKGAPAIDRLRRASAPAGGQHPVAPR